MNRSTARNFGWTLAGLATGGALLTAVLAAQASPPAADWEVPDPSPTVTETVVQRVPQPQATITKTKPAAPQPTKTQVKPAKPAPKATITKTTKPFGFNSGDCKEEDSCHPDYDGHKDNWKIKPGEAPQPKAATRQQQQAEDPEPEPAPAAGEDVSTNGDPVPGTEVRLPQKQEPVTPDLPLAPTR